MTLEQLNFYLTILSIVVTVIGVILTILSLIQAAGANKYAKKALLVTERDRFNEVISIIQDIKSYLVSIQSATNPLNRRKGENPVKKVNEFGEKIKVKFNDLKRIFPDSRIDLLDKSKEYCLLIDSLISAKRASEIKSSKISDFDSYLDDIQTSIKKEQAKSADELS